MSVSTPHPGWPDLRLRDPAQLHTLVATSLGVDHIDRSDLRVTEVPYDIPALTTRGRYRVVGEAQTGTRTRSVSIFVKVVQSWGLSPAFQEVPAPFRSAALALLPWAVEPAVYRSALATALPRGLRMPETYAVVDLDADSAAIWMEDVQTAPRTWDIADHQRAARLLGRFAASTAVLAAIEPLSDVIPSQPLEGYVGGRIAGQIRPALLSEELWTHRLVAAHFGDLRARLCTLADRLPTLLVELLALPAGVCHGDACTRNLLVAPDGGDLVMIDFGFVRFGPLGLDLGQLVLGEIQLGERSADGLEELWRACLRAYLDGIEAEGNQATTEQVTRASAICMAIFTGVSAIPFELLGNPVDPVLEQIFAARAHVARFSLDLLEEPC